MSNLSESVIFPKGQKITNNYFIGEAWLEMLVPFDTTFNCPVGNVTFEPGARNNWHKHAGGQILLVTSGIGYYQEEGKPVQVLHEGDVVKIAPNVKHWHGANPDSWFSHIAISTNVHRGDTEWLKPVTDEEYNNLNKA
ncbi:cupin [Paenibacillus baekrokdamisoli]|uniref:Cupin n=1 Tax=Paenibacillus baekrokdamisoli TaxID=1712516 RepID=A0A3G9J659_9BACL|nr:cupin domain-containing protein [Paenibacillus baekrokdamisoli]MBB3067577.1 quercetin dioxygenase-like cupin family protein [Paenibacillus baekrokdamisoli]BBH19238.1 cupin [Paenibacillus baekrokdamisoli]